MHHATAGSLLGIPGVAWFWVLTLLGVGAVVISLGFRVPARATTASTVRWRRSSAERYFDCIGMKAQKIVSDYYLSGNRVNCKPADDAG